jgi:hypothetical protein
MAGAVAAIAAPGAAASPVIPFPGTPDASPSTSVIFSSLAPSDLGTVRVTGSSSGNHAGRLLTLPDGAGAAFLPQRPFTPGEQVRVDARLRSISAAVGLLFARPRAARRPGSAWAPRVRFSFGVGVERPMGWPPPGAPVVTQPAARSSSHHGIGPAQHFHSAPWLDPPVVHSSSDSDTTSGDMFLTPNKGPENGVLIVNARGQLVWFRAVSPSVFNVQVQRYQGRPVMTWWQGKVTTGPDNSAGEDVIVDGSYRTVAVVRAGNGYRANLHEFTLTRQNTALLNVAVPVRHDLRSVGGPRDGLVYDDIIQNVDIKTGRVLWEWHSLGHIPLTASYDRPIGSDPFDYFHLNSIQQLPDGDLLLSARNTWAAYRVSVRTGRVLWTLGGKLSSFRMGPGTQFRWQHDIRERGSDLTVFDDAADGFSKPVDASAKLLRLGRHGVTLVHRYGHRPPLLASIMGSAELLPNRNVFVGWGSASDFSEYNRWGKQIFNGRFATGVVSYRAKRAPWTGRPAQPPVMAVAPRPGGRLTVWASWNGATDVAAWRVMGGSSRNQLTSQARKANRSFETAITLASRPRYLMVQALDSRGHVLGSTAVRSVDRGGQASAARSSSGPVAPARYQ